jgi:hypothetical protein
VPPSYSLRVLPFGWTLKDLAGAATLADSYGAEPSDVLAIWFSESGLNPRNASEGYFGLIMGRDDFVTQTAGMPRGSWEQIVTSAPLGTQLAAIQRFWDATIRLWMKAPQGSEGAVLNARAAQLGVTPAGFLYALNFVPAWAIRIKTADQPMIRSAELGGGDPNAQDSEARYYRDNPGFDVTQKGYISMRDMDLRISKFRDRALADAGARQLLTGASVVEASYVTGESSGPSEPRRPPPSPWLPLLGITVAFGAIGIGLYALDRAIPKP